MFCFRALIMEQILEAMKEILVKTHFLDDGASGLYPATLRFKLETYRWSILSIDGYSAKKISLLGKIIAKKSPIFHFQEWKSIQICTFLGKNCQNLHFFGGKNRTKLHFFGKNLTKFALFSVKISLINIYTRFPLYFYFSRIFTYDFVTFNILLELRFTPTHQKMQRNITRTNWDTTYEFQTCIKMILASGESFIAKNTFAGRKKVGTNSSGSLPILTLAFWLMLKLMVAWPMLMWIFSL